MEKTVYDITLALGQSAPRRQVTVKRYDSHTTLRLRLVAGGKPYPIAEDCYGVFTARKPDDTVIYNPCVREGNVFLYALTPQTTAAVGELRCELKLYGPEEALLTSAAFLMEVEDTVYNGDEELASSQEAEALTQMVESVRQSLAKVDTFLEQTEDLARIDDTQIGEKAWSGKEIVDTLCPSFGLSGSVVTCAPIQRYPLEIVSVIPETRNEINSLQLYRGGKNLFDFKATPYEVTYGVENPATHIGFKIQIPAGTYTLHAEGTPETDGDYIYGGVCNASGEIVTRCNLVANADMYTHTITLSEGDVVYIYNSERNLNVSVAEDLFNRFNVQIEAGDVATDYEPYRGELFTADFSELIAYAGNPARYDWNTGIVLDSLGDYYQHDPTAGTFEAISDIDTYEAQTVRIIPALAGTNCIYDAAGTVEVKCALDPKQVIDELNQEIDNLNDEVEALQAEQNKTYELIEDVTLEEDVTAFLRYMDLNGSDYNFSAIRVYVEAKPNANASSSKQLVLNWWNSKDGKNYYHQANNGIGTTEKVTTFEVSNNHGLTTCYSINSSGATLGGTLVVRPLYNGIQPWENIWQLKLTTYPTTIVIPAGSRIRIYAIRG